MDVKKGFGKYMSAGDNDHLCVGDGGQRRFGVLPEIDTFWRPPDPPDL